MNIEVMRTNLLAARAALNACCVGGFPVPREPVSRGVAACRRALDLAPAPAPAASVFTVQEALLLDYRAVLCESAGALSSVVRRAGGWRGLCDDARGRCADCLARLDRLLDGSLTFRDMPTLLRPPVARAMRALTSDPVQ